MKYRINRRDYFWWFAYFVICVVLPLGLPYILKAWWP